MEAVEAIEVVVSGEEWRAAARIASSDGDQPAREVHTLGSGVLPASWRLPLAGPRARATAAATLTELAAAQADADAARSSLAELQAKVDQIPARARRSAGL